MLTSLATDAIVFDRPAYRPYVAKVARIRPLSAHFTRITFASPDFGVFGTAGLDQRIKIVLPLAHCGISDFGAGDEETINDGTWYERWRTLPHGERNPFRTYTVRDIRPADGELDVDFVTHALANPGDGGPAARWLLEVEEGDIIVIVGPDERSSNSRSGLDWNPGEATQVLLAGDETAAPAICAILESLPAGTRARAFIETPDAEDAIGLALHPDCVVTWLARGDAPHGERLDSAVREWVSRNGTLISPVVLESAQPLADIDVDREVLWDSPVVSGLDSAPGASTGRGASTASGDFYAWLAGEAAVIKRLRRFLVSETGVDRRRVAFMGYWRHGKAEAQ